MRFAIVDVPSPNVNERPESAPIDLVILHYTGMVDGPSAIERLRDPDAKVSAHYVVQEDGGIIRLVDESLRAWHAGVSSWGGAGDLNSRSIGIEIVNGGHDFGLPDFPAVQIDAVINLLTDILARRGITPFRVVGHSDVAPARKDDPGEKFPWKRLAAAGVAIAPNVTETRRDVVHGPGAQGVDVAAAQANLAAIGYGLDATGVLDEATQCVVRAFQRRFRPDRIDGALDLETLALIAEMARLTA